MNFDYYYGAQAEQFNFIRIPRVMITENTFSDLSLQAKILYSILLDRMTLSRKNSWFDEDNRVFIIYPISDIQSDLGFSRKKAMEYLTELEAFGLVEKKKRGFGLPSIIYVKSFMSQEVTRGIEMGTTGKATNIYEARGAEKGTSGGSQKDISRGPKTGTTIVPKPTLQEVPVRAPLKNKTNINQNYMNENKSNHILSYSGQDVIRCDEMPDQTLQAYGEIIRKNIEYDSLLITHNHDQELVEGIYNLILETVMSKRKEILIASEHYPAELVKSKFLKLNYSHIDYVIQCLHGNTTKVKNIKKYLLAALFNAPSTMDGYYCAEVNHDMPMFAR